LDITLPRIMKNGNQVQSVVKALAILECFSFQERELSVLDISEKLDIPRPTVSRLAGTLCQKGYLQQDLSNSKYSLGMKLFHLGSIVEHDKELQSTALPILKNLRDEFGETTYMDIVDESERICIISLEGNHDVRSIVPIGQRSPLHAGADGRVLLSSFDEHELDSFLTETNLDSFTSKTITDKQQLKEMVRQIREKGVAVSVEEFVCGSVAIACPVKDRTGQVVAGISLSVPVFRATEERLKKFKQSVIKAAAEISRALGYTKGSGGM